MSVRSGGPTQSRNGGRKKLSRRTTISSLDDSLHGDDDDYPDSNSFCTLSSIQTSYTQRSQRFVIEGGSLCSVGEMLEPKHKNSRVSHTQTTSSAHATETRNSLVEIDGKDSYSFEKTEIAPHLSQSAAEGAAKLSRPSRVSSLAGTCREHNSNGVEAEMRRMPSNTIMALVRKPPGGSMSIRSNAVSHGTTSIPLTANTNANSVTSMQSQASSRGSGSSRRKMLVRRTTNASLDDILHEMSNHDALSDHSDHGGGNSIASAISSLGFGSATANRRVRPVIISASKNDVMKSHSNHSTSVSSLGSARSNRSRLLERRETRASLDDLLHEVEEDNRVGGFVNKAGDGPPNSIHVASRIPGVVERKADFRKRFLYPQKSPTKVQFSTVDIREYEMEIGDNPSCSRGPAITLGWKVTKCELYRSVDAFDCKRANTRKDKAHRLIMSRQERELMLLENGFSRFEIADSVRKIIRTKNQRRQTVNNLPIARFEEAIESAGRKVKKMLVPTKYKSVGEYSHKWARSSDSSCNSDASGSVSSVLKASSDVGDYTHANFKSARDSRTISKLKVSLRRKSSSQYPITAVEPDHVSDTLRTNHSSSALTVFADYTDDEAASTLMAKSSYN